jgi:hypothetical protein
MDGALGKPKHRSMVRTGDVWMLEHETYLEKKWLERHGIWEDSIHLRGTHSRVKDEQRGKHCGSKSIMSHLRDTNLSWGRHLYFATGLALKLFLLSLIALVHGLLPFIFTSKVSDEVYKLNEELS